MSVNEWDVASGEPKDARSGYVALANDEATPNPFGDDGQLSSERVSTSLNDSGQPVKDPRRSRLSAGRVSARSSGAELDRVSMHEHAVEKGSTMQVSSWGDGPCGKWEKEKEARRARAGKGWARCNCTVPNHRPTRHTRHFYGRASV